MESLNRFLQGKTKENSNSKVKLTSEQKYISHSNSAKNFQQNLRNYDNALELKFQPLNKQLIFQTKQQKTKQIPQNTKFFVDTSKKIKTFNSAYKDFIKKSFKQRDNKIDEQIQNLKIQNYFPIFSKEQLKKEIHDIQSSEQSSQSIQQVKEQIEIQNNELYQQRMNIQQINLNVEQIDIIQQSPVEGKQNQDISNNFEQNQVNLYQESINIQEEENKSENKSDQSFKKNKKIKKRLRKKEKKRIARLNKSKNLPIQVENFIMSLNNNQSFQDHNLLIKQLTKQLNEEQFIRLKNELKRLS